MLRKVQTMKKITLPFAAGAVGALLTLIAPATSLAEVDRAAQITTTCFSCHSVDGAGSMPGLVGYPRDMLISQMQAFKDGSRPATIMGRIAKGYSEDEFVLMADYLSTLQ
jgi:sulfide dehydrogenase cytochrome subunit